MKWLFFIIFIFNLFSFQNNTLAADLKLPLLWEVNLKSFLESAPTVADINGDGRDEIIVAGREEIITLNKNGKELWRWRTRGRFIVLSVKSSFFLQKNLHSYRA